MVTKEAVLERLQQNVLPDGTSQFDYSRDMSAKHLEQELLDELETEGYIQQLTISLGYALYRLL